MQLQDFLAERIQKQNKEFSEDLTLVDKVDLKEKDEEDSIELFIQNLQKVETIDDNFRSHIEEEDSLVSYQDFQKITENELTFGNIHQAYKDNIEDPREKTLATTREELLREDSLSDFLSVEIERLFDFDERYLIKIESTYRALRTRFVNSEENYNQLKDSIQKSNEIKEEAFDDFF